MGFRWPDCICCTPPPSSSSSSPSSSSSTPSSTPSSTVSTISSSNNFLACCPSIPLPDSLTLTITAPNCCGDGTPNPLHGATLNLSRSWTSCTYHPILKVNLCEACYYGEDTYDCRTNATDCDPTNPATGLFFTPVLFTFQTCCRDFLQTNTWDGIWFCADSGPGVPESPDTYSCDWGSSGSGSSGDTLYLFWGSRAPSSNCCQACSMDFTVTL